MTTAERCEARVIDRDAQTATPNSLAPTRKCDELDGFWFTMFGLVALFFGVALGVTLQHATGEHDIQVVRACYAIFARGDTVAALRWDRRCLDVLPEEAR